MRRFSRPPFCALLIVEPSDNAATAAPATSLAATLCATPSPCVASRSRDCSAVWAGGVALLWSANRLRFSTQAEAALAAPAAPPITAARFWLSACESCCCAAAIARASPEACADRRASFASSTARPAFLYASKDATPVPTADIFVETLLRLSANFPSPLAALEANVETPEAIPLPMLARPPITFPLLRLDTPCRAREAAFATFATRAAPAANLLAIPAAPPTTDAAAVTIPSRLFDLIACTSEIAPWAASANGARGVKLRAVSAIGATFLIAPQTLEKKPGFLHDDCATCPFEPTSSFRLCFPILISDLPGPAFTADSTSWSFFDTSASDSLVSACPGTFATPQS